MKTPCCGYEWTEASKSPYPVFFSEGLVRCHHCGHIYEPMVKWKQQIAELTEARDLALIEVAELREALSHFKNHPPPHPHQAVLEDYQAQAKSAVERAVRDMDGDPESNP